MQNISIFNQKLCNTVELGFVAVRNKGSVLFSVLLGHVDVVRFLTETCNVDPFVKDR